MTVQYTAGRFKADDDNGNPLTSARLYTYAAGTTTHQNAYTTKDVTVPVTYTYDGIGGQYIAMNSRGEALLFLSGLVSYTLTLKTSLGAVIWTDDPPSDSGDNLRADLSATGGAALVNDAARTTVLAASSGSLAIGHIATGANVVATTLGARARLFNYIQDVGGIADGNWSTGAGTDNSTMLQNALNKLATSGGGSLIIPPGQYKLASQIVIPDGVSLLGSGKWNSLFFCPTSFATTGGLIRASGGTAPGTFSGFGVICFGGCAGYGIVSAKNGFTTRDVWVTGFGVGIQIAQTSNALHDFIVELCTSAGVYLTEASTNVSFGEIYQVSAHGILVSNSAAADFHPILIDTVRAEECGQTGFNMSSAKEVSLVNCSATHSTNAKMATGGLVIDSSTGIRADSFIGRLGTTSTTGDGILISNSSNINIGGSTVIKGFRDGLSISGGSGVTVVGMHCTNNGRHGANLQGGTEFAITGGRYSYNGLTAGGVGVNTNNSATDSVHSVTGIIALQGAGGPQTYGISANVTNNGASSGVTGLIGNNTRYNSTGTIQKTGLTANITDVGNF
jgi:hypothetical protein